MATTYEAIATVEVGSGGAADIEFTSIPATFTDLQILVSARSDAVAFSNAVGLYLKFNSSATGYAWRRLLNNSGGVSSDNNAADTALLIGAQNAASDTSNTFTSTSTYVPNYLSSNNKSVSSDSTAENNGTTVSGFFIAGLWSNSAAITSITLNASSGNFVEHSTATLYGIKNS